MPFEMPETDWFGSSRDIPVSEAAAGGTSPTQLALEGSAAPAATEANRPAAQGESQTGATQPSVTQTPPEATAGVALAPAESVPLLASREAAFVAGYPNNPQATTSRESESAAQTTTPGAPPKPGNATGSFKVQLASYLSMEAVEQEWVRLQAAYPELLRDKTLSVREADLGADGIVYGVRTGAFADRLSAETFCDKMAARGEDCLVVGGPGSTKGTTEATSRRVVSREQTKGLADVQKEALFEQFLQWQRRRDYGIEGGNAANADKSVLFEQFLQWREQRTE